MTWGALLARMGVNFALEVSSDGHPITDLVLAKGPCLTCRQEQSPPRSPPMPRTVSWTPSKPCHTLWKPQGGKCTGGEAEGP